MNGFGSYVETVILLIIMTCRIQDITSFGRLSSELQKNGEMLTKIVFAGTGALKNMLGVQETRR